MERHDRERLQQRLKRARHEYRAAGFYFEDGSRCFEPEDLDLQELRVERYVHVRESRAYNTLVEAGELQPYKHRAP